MKYVFLAVSLCLASTLFAKEPDDSISAQIAKELKKIDSVEKTLHYQTGKIELQNGLATLQIPKGFKFLNSSEAKYIIEDIWGNLKGQTPLGMIVPENSMASIANYAFIVEFQDIGYVKDDDAHKINYTDLLKEMKEDNEKANEERKKQGLTSMSLIGWATPPHYDSQKKILYWAKEYGVEGNESNTLNYDIRLLGRKGVLVLQAVSSMDQLDSVNKNIDAVLGMVFFNDGHKYSDFDASTDNVAAWTIGGLVAGKVLAKVGFFALILKYIKIIIIAIGAAASAIWRFITGRRKKEEEYQPVPVADESAES
jgi:uncharacterized membrane-anchored protein